MKKQHIAALAALVSLVAGAVFFLSNSPETSPAASKPAKPPRVSQQISMPNIRVRAANSVDQLISRADRAMDTLESELSPLLHKLKPDVRGKVQKVFNLYRQNRTTNQDRNRIRLIEKTGLQNNRFERTSFFCFDLMEPQTRDPVAMTPWATFLPFHQILYLRGDFNPEVLEDRVALFHEIVHAVQGERLLEEEGSFSVEAWRQWNRETTYANQPSSIVESEWEAYDLQLEILDVLLDSRVSNWVPGDERTIRDCARRLNPHLPEEFTSTRLLFTLGTDKFAGRVEQFRLQIIHLELAAGRTPYVSGPNRTIVPWRPR